MKWKSSSVKPCTSEASENNRFEGQSAKCAYSVLQLKGWWCEAGVPETGRSAGQGRKAKELEELKLKAMQLASNCTALRRGYAEKQHQLSCVSACQERKAKELEELNATLAELGIEHAAPSGADADAEAEKKKKKKKDRCKP